MPLGRTRMTIEEYTNRVTEIIHNKTSLFDLPDDFYRQVANGFIKMYSAEYVADQIIFADCEKRAQCPGAP